MASGVQFRWSGQAGRGGGLLAVPFFCIFLAAGLFFEWLVVRDFAHTVRTYFWTKTDCEIVSSGISDPQETKRHSGDYRFEVQFRYTVEGRTRTSRQFTSKEKTFSDYSDAQRLALRYPAGSPAVCYANPAAPEEAVLEHESLWSGLAMLFPLVFVGVGGGGVFFAIRGFLRRRPAPAAPAGAEAPISDRAADLTGRKFLTVFFGIFLLMGGVCFYFLTIHPLWLIFDARRWQQTPCTVVSSEVRSHSGKSTTYSVNILYAYDVNGQQYRANRYHFLGGSSSGYDGKAAVVRLYPPGAKKVCYVNPADPTDAVLERGFTLDMLWGLFPLPFMAIGAGGLVWTLRTRPGLGASLSPKSAPRALVASPSGTARDLRPAGDSFDAPPKVLKAASPRVAKLFGALFMAAFWNGIVSVFVWQVVQSWRHHDPEWFLTVFMIPFVLIGLLIIGFVFYTFLSLFNPRPRLTITPGMPALGGPLEVQWELSGRTQVIRRLRIHAEGREEATFQSGKNTVTEKSIFARLELLDTTDRLALQAGQARLVVPPGLMHSWAGSRNKIIWSLRVHGDIAWWPDVKEEFPLTMLPQKPGPAHTP